MTILIEYDEKEIPLRTEALRMVEFFVNHMRGSGRVDSITEYSRDGHKYKISLATSVAINESYTIERIKP